MGYIDNATKLYQLIGEGKSIDAFEKFYHNDVVMVEANGDKRSGKETNRKFEIEFFSTIEEMHGGGVSSITSNEEKGVTMVESWMDVTYKDGKRVKMEEVAVQQWQNDHIIHERFYYNM